MRRNRAHNKPRLTFFDKLVLFATFLGAIFLIAGANAGHFDPKDHIIIAFMGLAYPFILLFNVIVLAWWLLRRQWLFATCLLVIIFSGYKVLFATFTLFGSEGNKERTADHLRVMTYNVHLFKKFGEDNDKQVKRKFLQILKDQQPDVVLFQEYYTRFKGEFNMTDSIKKMLNVKYYYFVPSSKNSYEAYGMAIFSRYPISNTNFIPFDEYNSNACMYVDIKVRDKNLRVYNVHLRSINFQAADYNYLEKVRKEINPDKQNSKRILRMLKDAFERRSDDVKLVQGSLKTCTTPYIIAGDFNDTPASYAVTQ
ncbi:MAG: endonuclease, partial [Sphingobacteriales bacterium]